VESEADGLPLSGRWPAVVVLSIGIVLAVLDTSIANVALPTIGRELHTDAALTIWVVNAFQIGVMITLLPFAALGDSIGYRRVYSGGLAVFTLGSLACALSHSLPLLIASRAFQGIGAAGIMSVAPALFRNVFPNRLLGQALGISALVVASSSAAGPTVGGAILAVLPWPWLFAVNVPLGTLDFFLARRLLPSKTGNGHPFDVPSALLSGPAIALLIVALDGFAHRNPPLVTTLLLAASALLLFVFVHRQRHLKYPMLRLELFGIERFSLAAATSLSSFTAQGLAVVALPFLYQVAFGYTPLAAGLLLTPWPLTIMVAAPLAGHLADRYPPPLLATGGLAVFSAGLALLALLPAHPATADIIWRSIVCGAGFGFFQAPNNRELMGSAPRQYSGNASGILATVRITGQSLGAAIVAVVLGTAGATLLEHSIHASAGFEAPLRLALWIASAFAGTAALVSALRLRALHRPVRASG
jgi:DHA2 family multidrug resistance protein-like MFS transporter